jgi:serine/threonine protein kinase/Flp pilus assembly protein TadD
MTPGETGKITDDRWEKVQELFSRAVELPEAERDAFIAREAGSDAELRKELVELLACDSGPSTGPLTQALGAALDATTRDRRKALLGRKVGNYKLVSVLGHGGTGTVYLGERADRQYSAQVAIKIVDSATLQGELGLRFRAERQILASLNHTNIARLLDAGETEDGQPYLVMEYVHGEPLDRYCDRHQLDLRGRLQLFLDICSAVQYAHQNLVVHRDLKPANILVTSEGAPKLLDFGIAKLLDAGGEAAAALALTRMNDRLLTPEYASPEQIMGRPVTTASDVYALGIVLYELLTGLRPYTVPASASQLELERSICVNDPLRPSVAVRRAIENGPIEGQTEMVVIALARGVTSEKLHRRLVGDVDAIVMRALRKEPLHRYSSVEQLAADVRRHLTQEPVHARQGTWLYYSQRFIRRHAFGVSAAAAFSLFMIAFAVAMSVQTRRVAAERDRAEQEGQRAEVVSEFMLDVFAAADPFTKPGQETTARELLDDAARRTQDLNQHPEVRARLVEAIGRAYRRQGQYDRSVSFLEEALRLRTKMPTESAKVASVLAELAIALRQIGDLDGAESALQRALQLSKEQGGNQRTASYAMLLTNLGRVELQAGRTAAAQGHFEQSLRLNRELLGSHHPEVANLHMELASVYLWKEEFEAAERAARQAVNIYHSTVHELHPDRVLADVRLAETLQAQNKLSEAAPLFEMTLQAQRRLYGEKSRQVADILDSLATVKRSQGLLDEAENLARQALKTHELGFGKKHFMTGYFSMTLGSLLARRGKLDEAERLLRDSLAIYDQTLPPDHGYVSAAEHHLGEVLLAANRLHDAEALLTAAMSRWRRTDAAPWRSARSASSLGEVLYREGRTQEAEQYLVDSYRVLAADEKADREARIKARERLVRFYTDTGQREKLDTIMLAISRDATPPQARQN